MVVVQVMKIVASSIRIEDLLTGFPHEHLDLHQGWQYKQPWGNRIINGDST